MPEVNTAITQIIRQKDRWLIGGPEKVLRLLAELQRQVRDELGRAALGSWDQYRAKQALDAIERAADEYVRRMQAEMGVDLRRFWDLGQRSVYEPLNQAGIYTGFNVSQSSLDAIAEFSFHKLAGVGRDAFDRIKSELTLGMLGQKTPQEIAAAIGENLDDPGIFSTIASRAETIVKTELGRTFSIAAEKRRQQAARSVPGLEKIWDHAGHPARPRPSHLAVHGQRVPVDEPFRLIDENGYRLMYPHDPNAAASEVINCGCDAVVWKDSWGDPPERFREAA